MPIEDVFLFVVDIAHRFIFPRMVQSKPVVPEVPVRHTCADFPTRWCTACSAPEPPKDASEAPKDVSYHHAALTLSGCTKYADLSKSWMGASDYGNV